MQGSYYEEIAAKCYAAYQKELQYNQCMDFDDLIMNTIRLFEEHPDSLTYYQNKFHYIHVDEYQDTNHAQYTLVNLLAGRFRNLCVVEMQIKVFTAGAVQICRTSWILKRLSRCCSNFARTKLSLHEKHP